MSLDDHWFTEKSKEAGSAFSLRIIQKLYEEQSPYQKIEIYETERFGNLMTIDGFVMLTGRDNFIYHEMVAHPALFSHSAPKKVLIVGGGDCGTLREVLKHTCVERAWQVEIDERVTRLAERFFPELCESNDDSRAIFRFEDAIEWVKRREAKSLDVIIVDSTDPIGPAEGLFREPFYRDCLRALRAGGLIVQQSESPLYHAQSVIKPMHAAMRQAGFAGVATLHFPQCVYPSGWWTATLARKEQSIRFAREAEAKTLPFATRYYNAALHRASFALPQFLLDAL